MVTRRRAKTKVKRRGLPPQARGPDHYNWKGGKWNHDRYVYVLSPNHPKAAQKKGYVAEHVLVMEKCIGRHLKKGETIHHKNLNKKDNRLSNLKLYRNNREHVKAEYAHHHE